jgi:hypothetical protein
VSGVLRRLVRICMHYQRTNRLTSSEARPALQEIKFVCLSATMANPVHHMYNLIPLRALRALCHGTREHMSDINGCTQQREKGIIITHLHEKS